MESKKNILLVQPPPPETVFSKENPIGCFFLKEARMTVVANDICPDFFISSPQFQPMGMPVSPNTTGYKVRINSHHDMDAFTKGIIEKIDTTGAVAVLFQIPFEDDEALFHMLEIINLEKKITMGITRVMGEGKNRFELPEKILNLLALRLIQWQVSHTEDDLDIRPLWQISRKGIWNHFILRSGKGFSEKNIFKSFIFANPNIAHSHNIPIPSMETPYKNVAPLPGIPLWRALDNAAHLLTYLTFYSQKNFFTMRVDMGTNAVFSLGSNINFYFEKPENLPTGYMDEICNMVEAGGSVATKWIRYNLERAFLIAYAMENGVIVGCSSLKRPRKPFIERINKISGMDFSRFLERGYTSVRPEYRALGVGAKLLGGLTARAEDRKIFSIISEDNTATRKIAIRNNTRKVVTYYSEKMGKTAGIWMPKSMIET